MTLFTLERTTPPQVFNKHHRNAPDTAVYIGRGSPYGNPFKIGENGTREDVIALFEEYLMGSPDLLRRVKEELRDKDLVCFCKPAGCHGDVILRAANA